MEKLLYNILTKYTKDCDVYYNGGSLWLIFTENKKWVLEFTKDGCLWFNFSFFEEFFNWFNLDVIENQNHITKWFEDNFLNKPKVKETIDLEMDDKQVVEYFIENGVKETLNTEYMPQEMVEETIENGVKEIEIHKGVRPSAVKDTIENGVKKTKRSYESSRRRRTKDTIENGVKETNHVDVMKFFDNKMECVLQNGVIHTEYGDWEDGDERLDDIIRNGVKETKEISNISLMSEIFNVNAKRAIRDGVKETKELYWENTPIIDDVIGNGVKEIKTPGKDGDLLGFLDFMSDNNTDSVPQLIDDVIVNGIIQTKAAYQTIYNPMNFSPELREEKRISDVTDVIDNGVKEIQPLSAQDGNRDWGNYYHRQEDRTKPHTEYVNDAMSSGIKKTIWRKVENFPEYENRIIVNGVLINNSKDWGIL
jgi:hypothetical protein